MKVKKQEIVLKNVSVKIGKTLILNDISLTINKGEFITLLGKNGSGKTTLLKTILGINKYFLGSIIVGGVSIKDGHVRNVRLKTGYVPQFFSAENNFPITAGDVIAMGKNKKQAEVWARNMEIINIIDKPFGKLSGGEKQKVMLAMALSREPEILLLDEPNLNLDIRAYKNFIELVEKLQQQLKLTVIYVTHLTGHIPKSCSRIVVIKDGEIYRDGPKRNILNNDKLEELIYE
ncbi:MAG: ABC transporter ATP-binding protein [bacterium]